MIAIPDGYKSAGDLDIEVKAAVGAVIYEHNYLSDLGPREQILDLYEEDCVLTGVLNVVGREALRAIVLEQPDDLVQRHHTSNIRLAWLEDGTVLAMTLSAVYRPRPDGDGTAVPTVAIVVGVHVLKRGSDGRWRFLRRHDERVFPSVGGSGPAGRELHR